MKKKKLNYTIKPNDDYNYSQFFPYAISFVNVFTDFI